MKLEPAPQYFFGELCAAFAFLCDYEAARGWEQGD